MNGCYDIGMLLVVDFDIDPAEPAEPGMGMGGKTPYDLCVKAQAESEAAGQQTHLDRSSGCTRDQ